METMMKAVVCKRYGPPEVLTLDEVNVPQIKDHEVLVQVHATAVTASDTYIRGYKIPLKMMIPMRLMVGITRPRKSVIGLVFSGVVVKTGGKTTRFEIGDDVYGMTGFTFGAYAQYAKVKEKDSTAGCIAIKPKNITHEEATSAVYGGSLAVQYMDKGHIKAGDNVIVYGASGTSGTIAVQYAKHLGAHVTAICGTKHLEFVRSLGADVVLDYRTTDVLPDQKSYDFMLDSVGKHKHSKLKDACLAAVKPSGSSISIDDGALELSSNRLNKITSLIEAKAIHPVIDSIYAFDQLAEAHRYVETGHKCGGVAVTVPH